jgi:hypothetical protein
MTSDTYVLKRKNGCLVEHVVLTRQSNGLYSDESVEVLAFTTERKALEVAKVLDGECEVILYENYSLKIAA